MRIWCCTPAMKAPDECWEETFRDWHPDFRTKRLKYPTFLCSPRSARAPSVVSLVSSLKVVAKALPFSWPSRSYTLGCCLFCVTSVTWIPTSARSSPSSSALVSFLFFHDKHENPIITHFIA